MPTNMMSVAAVARALLMTAALLLSLPVFAVETHLSEKKTVTNPVGAEQLANVTLGLLAVLALIFALAWLYRRYGNYTPFNRADIQVLGGVSLGSREKAVLLEVEGTRLLVGVATGHISTLHVFHSQDTTDLQTVADHSEDFAEKLHNEMTEGAQSVTKAEAGHVA
jgi:flagellar protein FliO/FliZ